MIITTPNQGDDKMLESIMDRRSVRKYTAEPVSEDTMKTILECAMLAPSAKDRRPWHFIVVDDRTVLDKICETQSFASSLQVQDPLRGYRECRDVDSEDQLEADIRYPRFNFLFRKSKPIYYIKQLQNHEKPDQEQDPVLL